MLLCTLMLFWSYIALYKYSVFSAITEKGWGAIIFRGTITFQIPQKGWYYFRKYGIQVTKQQREVLDIITSSITFPDSSSGSRWLLLRLKTTCDSSFSDSVETDFWTWPSNFAVLLSLWVLLDADAGWLRVPFSTFDSASSTLFFCFCSRNFYLYRDSPT